FKVDDFSALLLRHFQTAGNSVNGEDTSCIQQPGAGDGKLPYRAAAEDSHSAARMDLGQISSHVAGGKNIGKQNGLIVQNVFRDLHQINIGKRDTHKLRLHAVKRTSSG